MVYAGLDPRAKQLVTRGGRIDLGDGGASWIEKEGGPAAAAQGARYAYAIYRVALGANRKVESIEPAIVIDEAVIMQSFFVGTTWEGVISKRTGDKMYEHAPSLPIRIEATSDLERLPNATRGYPTVRLSAKVSNLTRHNEGTGHGTPGYIPSVTLDLVNGGGQTCP